MHGNGRVVVEPNMGAIATVMEYGSETQKKLAAQLVIAGRQAGDLHHGTRSPQRCPCDDDTS
jgi:hypothetical protein